MQTEPYLQTALQFHQRGEFDKASAAYQYVLQLEPQNIDALHLLGVIAQQTGDPREALRLISKAIALNPKVATFYSNLGNAYRDLCHFSEAEISYQAAIQLHPNYVDPMINLAALFIQTEDYQQALEWADKALSYGPHAYALSHRGVAKKHLGFLTEAKQNLEQALQLYPKFPQAWTNLGNILRDLKNYPAALRAHDQAISLQPTFADAWNNRGYVLKQMGKFEEALKSYDEALKLKPEFIGAQWNKSMILLHQNHWNLGFELYESRRQMKNAFQFPLAIPEWKGESLAGKRIVIYIEQGMGDTFQFIRLIDRLLEMKAEVSLSCPPNLHRLLSSWAKNCVHLIGFDFQAEDFDYQSSLMSLPHKLKLQPEEINSMSVYFKAEPEIVEKWKEKLSSSQGMKVGICWQGNPKFPEDALRSIPLQFFEPLLEYKNIEFFSLQKGYGSEQIQTSAFQNRIQDYTAEFDASGDAFTDVAGLIKNLDLVITIDSAIAHLSGALGCKTLILLPKISDWRWGLEGHDRNWYSSAELIRQSQFFDWSDVIGKIKSHLK